MARVTIEEMNTMVVELVTGAPPSLNTPEAEEMREKLRKDIADIKARGGSVDFVKEMPDPTPHMTKRETA